MIKNSDFWEDLRKMTRLKFMSEGLFVPTVNLTEFKSSCAEQEFSGNQLSKSIREPVTDEQDESSVTRKQNGEK